MSQGLTWIAGRRTPLLALVALFALAVGMFTAFSPTRADSHEIVGDVNSNTGRCLALLDATDDTDAYGLYYDDAEEPGVPTNNDPAVAVWVADLEIDDLPATKEPGFKAVTTPLCQDTLPDGPDANTERDASPALNHTFRITPNGTTSPLIEMLSPTLVITIKDSDGVIKAGTDVTGSIKLTNATDVADVDLDWVRVSGNLNGNEYNDPTTGLNLETTNVNDAAGEALKIIVPDGTSEGEYVISARTAGTDDRPAVSAEPVTITVGDAGVNAATATLSLGDKTPAAPLRGTPAVAEDGTEPASASIWLKVEAQNSLGNPSNNSGLNTLTVIAPGGRVTIYGVTAGARSMTAADGPDSDSASATTPETAATNDEVGSTMYVSIGKVGGKPGTVDVYALLIGSDGAPRTETLTLSFTGQGTALDLGDAKAVAPNSKTEFTIGATDGSGNTADVPQLSFNVTDADGKAAAYVKATKSTVGQSTDDDPDDNTDAPAGLVTVDKKATPGVYNVEVSIPGVKDSAATTVVIVTGVPASLELGASATTSETVGDVITVSATVTDADGNNVVDDTPVNFSASANTGLAAIGAAHADNADGKGGPRTRDGAASAKFAVIGAGTSVVSATAGGVSAVVVIRSTAGEAAAVDEPDPEPADGLSQTELNNFASWSGEGSVSASELLAGIADATGVLFYDGDSWQRYGVSDGQVIPGSRDFTIRSGQTIWISG